LKHTIKFLPYQTHNQNSS